MPQEPHPLAVLRSLTGDTQESYVRLVSATHRKLGFGALGCRREKVSRWESQGVPPDYRTQLAIAAIHHVPESEVLRMGWPHWLRMGTAAHSLVDRGKLGELLTQTSCEPSEPASGSRLSTKGEALSGYLHEVLTTLAASPVAVDGDRKIGADTADLVEHRAQELHRLVATANPVALQRTVCSEHELVKLLLREFAYDRTTSIRLHMVAAKFTQTGGWISQVLDQTSLAERCLHAAIEASARTGASALTAARLSDLAWLHVEAGNPRDALLLTDAARSLVANLHPQNQIVILSREARARARLGNIIDSSRALNRMVDLDPLRAGDDFAQYINVDADWIRLTTARAWLDAGHARLASEQFLAVLGNNCPGPARQPPLLLARDYLGLVDAQLLLGEIEEATLTTRRAMALFTLVPMGLLMAFRRRFDRWHDLSDVRDLMSSLLTTPVYA